MTLQKTHQYKVFTPAGVYLGQLPTPSSEFGYNQTIATAFAQMQVRVPVSADVASLPVEAITDESGNAITDESGNAILIEKQPDIVGSSNPKALIANNNLIQVWEYSNYYPNGLQVFSGYISKWKATFGATDDILLTCISQGQDLNNYLVLTGETMDVNLTGFGSSLLTYRDIVANNGLVIVQSFTVGAGVTTVSSILLGGTSVLSADYVLIGLYDNQTTAEADASFSQSLNSLVLQPQFTNVASNVKATFGTPIAVQPGAVMWLRIQCIDTNGVFMAYDAASSYAGGVLRTATGAYPTSFSTIAGAALFLQTYSFGGNVTSTYTNQDPSAILASVVSNYISQGGFCTAPVAGYTSTGVLTSYTFKLQTSLQGIQTVLSLAPANWYWYVDPATNIIQFKQASTTADITLVNQRHINELEIEATKEGVKTIAYFTGGDDGTSTNTNILVKVSNTPGTNRTGLALLSDNRVNSAAGGTVAAKLIAQNYLNNNSAETYITTVTVQDQTVDINLFKLGMMVGFAGFGNFVESLLLQIVGVNRSPDQVTLQLGTVPTRPTQEVAQIAAQLAYTQTVANQTTPS